MKLVVLFNSDKLLGKLTKLFTGCYAYHTAWVSDKVMYDIHWTRRRRLWPGKYSSDTYLVFDFPKVTQEYLEKKLTEDETKYSYLDYFLFCLRPFYHLFGYSTRNYNGMICSEMMNIDLRFCGYETPWDLKDPPPSPCDLYRWLIGDKNGS